MEKPDYSKYFLALKKLKIIQFLNVDINKTGFINFSTLPIIEKMTLKICKFDDYEKSISNFPYQVLKLLGFNRGFNKFQFFCWENFFFS